MVANITQKGWHNIRQVLYCNTWISSQFCIDGTSILKETAVSYTFLLSFCLCLLTLLSRSTYQVGQSNRNWRPNQGDGILFWRTHRIQRGFGPNRNKQKQNFLLISVITAYFANFQNYSYFQLPYKGTLTQIRSPFILLLSFYAYFSCHRNNEKKPHLKWTMEPSYFCGLVLHHFVLVTGRHAWGL